VLQGRRLRLTLQPLLGALIQLGQPPHRVGGQVSGAVARADVVTDWNIAFENSLPAPAQRSEARLPIRPLVLLHVAMFDAINGIDRRYQPAFVTDLAPPGARAEDPMVIGFVTHAQGDPFVQPAVGLATNVVVLPTVPLPFLTSHFVSRANPWIPSIEIAPGDRTPAIVT